MIFLWWNIGALIFYKVLFAAVLTPYESAHLGLVPAFLMAGAVAVSVYFWARYYAIALGRTHGRALFQNAGVGLFWRFAWWIPLAAAAGLIIVNWLVIYGFSPRLTRMIEFNYPRDISYGTRYVLICMIPPVLHAVLTTIAAAGSLRQAAERRAGA